MTFTTLIAILVIGGALIVWVGSLISNAYDKSIRKQVAKEYVCTNCQRENAYEFTDQETDEYTVTREEHHSRRGDDDTSYNPIERTYQVTSYKTTYKCKYCGHTKVEYRKHEHRI